MEEKELASGKIQNDLFLGLELYEKWYGPGFIEVKSEDGNQVAFVKVDGNRRTRIFKKNLSTVRVEIMDLNIQHELEKDPA